MTMRNDVLAMVLVGGRGSRLNPITKRIAKPAVPFGGKYKLIDFVLSNLSNSFIRNIGIITQYQPHSLMQYIAHGSSWDLDVTEGGVQFLTPYTSYEGDEWQKGTAHAIKQHYHFIKQHDPDYVLILAGDHVYKMDYNQMLKTHQENNADITISAFRPQDDPSRYGILHCDNDNRVTAFYEKPEKPDSHLASMGIYIFNRKALENILSGHMEASFDFGADIIPQALKENYTVHAHIFNGYFRDVGTVKSLFAANMDLIDHPQYLRLNDYVELPLYTRSADYPPHHIIREETIEDSLISDGCLIEGHLKRCILSHNVTVKFGAALENTLLYPGVSVGENSVLKNVIVLDGTVILPNTRIVYDVPTVIDNESLWALGVEDHE